MRILFFIVVPILFFSCISNQDNLVKKSVFRYNEPAGISSLDPTFARNIENVRAVDQLFNGLLQMDSTLQIKPCISSNWEVSEDNKVYTFYLRDDVYFHDNECFEEGYGRKVTAYDFVYSFKRIIDPKVASPGAWIFNYLYKSEENDYLGFIAKAERTFKIYLKKAFPPFLGILTMHYCSVIPKEAIDYYGKDFRRYPVGTGPFQFKMWDEGTKLVFTKNQNYFERDGEYQLPYIDAVSISFVQDRQLSFLDFMRNKYDFMSGLEGNFTDKVYSNNGELQPEYQGKFRVQKLPYLKTDYLGILVNEELELVKNSPLKFKKVRRAINYGFDRIKMVKYLKNGIGIPALAGFIPTGMPSFDSTKVKGYTYDPNFARELLVSAGFPNGKGLPKITITTTMAHQNVCEYIQHAISDIGIKADVDIIDEATYREMIAQSRLNFFRKSWIADYPDSENFLALFYSKNFCPTGPNYTHYSNAEFDRLYELAMGENDIKIRYDYYRKMDQMILDDAPIVPLYYDQVSRFVHHNITGLESNPLNLLSLKKVKIK